MTLPVLRLLWSLILLAAPGTVGRRMGSGDDQRTRIVLRILGGRHLVEAAIDLRRRSPSKIVPVIDGVHAATALGFGILDRRRRRAAAVDAVIAAGFALVGARDAY